MVNNKLVLFGNKARQKLMTGVDFIAGAVKLTLGPYGQNWFLEKGNKVTNDGVTIAKEMWLKDELGHRGVVAMQQAADKTNNEVGDGTTTSIILAQAIVKEAVKEIGDASGLSRKRSPVEVMKQITRERDEVITLLREKATPIKTEQDLINSAIVSVEDKELGEMIGKTQFELGAEGVILAEEDAGKETTIEKVVGIRIDNGFGTSMIVNNQEKNTLEVKDTRVILTSHTLHDFQPLVEENQMKPPKIINQLVGKNFRNFTIVARAFTSEAIKVCMENIKRGILIHPINAPYENQAEVMKDMAAVLGGTFYHDESASLEDMQISDVGFATKVVAGRWSAIFTGKNDEEAQKRVAKRIIEIEKELAGEKSDFMKKKLRERIAQLKSGFAVLKVTGVNEIDRKYKFDKCVDAVNAVRVAYQTGTVKGAGLAFQEIAETLPDTYILKKPLMTIWEQIKATAPDGFVVPEWVRDPVGVLECSLRNACSVAGTIATAAGIVASERPKNRVVELKDNEDEDEKI